MSTIAPTANRVAQDDGSSKSLKMSIGKKKLRADGQQEMARIMYKTMWVNGVQYCRRHLMIRCHLCEEDSTHLRQEADAERTRLGLRPGGDPFLNQRTEEWGEFTLKSSLQLQRQVDDLVRQYGKDHARTHPQQWHRLMTEFKAEERRINDRFLTENDDVVRKQGASHCSYWACTTPHGAPLLKCAGCGIVKYCCKEHQLLDWKWEHRGECTSSLPTWFKEEIEQDRERNLKGDYTEYK